MVHLHDGCLDSAVSSRWLRRWVELLRVRAWSAIPSGFLVLAARRGKPTFKVSKGQEWEHADRLARGSGAPSLLDGRSSLALNNLRLSLCHKQARPTVPRGAQS